MENGLKIIYGVQLLFKPQGTPDSFSENFSPNEITVTEAEDNIDFIIYEEDYNVHGRLVDGNNVGIADAKISFSSIASFNNSHISSVYTDNDGYFSKVGLNGIVEVIPEKDGYEFIPETREVSGYSDSVNFEGNLID